MARASSAVYRPPASAPAMPTRVGLLCLAYGWTAADLAARSGLPLAAAECAIAKGARQSAAILTACCRAFALPPGVVSRDPCPACGDTGFWTLGGCAVCGYERC